MLQFKVSNTNERLQTPEGEAFGSFVHGLSARLSIPVDRLVLMTGFPAAAIFADPDATVKSAGLQSGSVITAREGVPPSVHQRGQPTHSVPPQEQQQDSTNGSITTLVAMGFDRDSAVRAIEIAGDDMGLAVEICQELSSTSSRNFQPTAAAPAAVVVAAPPPPPKMRRITRRVIDADNSCLFNAVGYLVERSRKQMNSIYRDVVA